MFPIDNRIDWNAIRAEYIGGGISQRKLAQKYGVPFPTLRDKAKREKWTNAADTARDKAVAETLQRTAEAAADNATLAQDVKKRLLLRLKRTEAKMPMDATEVKVVEGGKTVVYRLRDLAAAYKDLTADIPTGEQAGNELLQALMDLERVAHD